ncbi:uncharacterized protein LOC127360062 [Dicentrarchus labrax]|uniref:uncharacterized protein LOC127360062 n=1 Tax=Dicentrarchus labrax TaxID=13489 RepID=UPI0021F663F5|nr:uncharacterized protein LOC127360062 [Dicentrarchus labrax]
MIRIGLSNGASLQNPMVLTTFSVQPKPPPRSPSPKQKNTTPFPSPELHNPQHGHPSSSCSWSTTPENWTYCRNSPWSSPWTSSTASWTASSRASSGPPPRRPSGQHPPGPLPGPPSHHPLGQPLFSPPSSHAGLPFYWPASCSSTLNSFNPLTTAEVTPPSSTPATSSPTNDDQTTISTTVARCLKVIETMKSLAVQPQAKLVKTVQFSLPTESPSASSPQTSAETDDDIKSKQKEKLDLYNQRVLEKREQQYKEMLARKKAEKNRDGTLIPQVSDRVKLH